MANRSADTVVVITGASAGVGRAIARRFAADGARIGLIARGMDGLTAAAREVEDAGSEALVVPCDVADHAAVEAAARKIEEKFGSIDIWINVAFAGVLARFTDIDPDDYKRVTDVTYLGQVNGTRAALKRMMPRNKGSIVLIGSALAYRGIPLQSAYCGAKHAIQGFHDSIRAELFHARSKVHVSMVQLPGVNTPQFDWIKTDMPRQPKPASPPYQPEIIAKAVHWAAHHRRKQIMVGFPTMQSDLGRSHRIVVARSLSWHDRISWSAGQRAGFAGSQEQSVGATPGRSRRARPFRFDRADKESAAGAVASSWLGRRRRGRRFGTRRMAARSA